MLPTADKSLEPVPVAGPCLISGGTVAASGELRRLDLLIRDGRIAALGEPGAFGDLDGFDATGLVLLPGLVDAHVHLREPANPVKETLGQASAAAAKGGITTVMVMPFEGPSIATAALLEERAAYCAGRVGFDFALQATLAANDPAGVAELAAAGAVSIELDLGEGDDASPPPTDEELRRTMEAAADAGITVGVCCQTPSVLEAARDKAFSSALGSLAGFEASEPVIGEVLSVFRAGLLTRETGARVHLRQITTAESVRAVRQLQAMGADLSFEVTPHHLLLDNEDPPEGGPASNPERKVSPPLRSRAVSAALLREIEPGDRCLIASDHAPHPRAEKSAGIADLREAPAGLPGLETALSAAFEACGEDLALLTRRCSELPADVFGLAGQKGRIAVGLDADIVAFDPAGRWRADAAGLATGAESTPFQGREMKGAVRFSLVHGALAFADGTVRGEHGGRFLRPLPIAKEGGI